MDVFLPLPPCPPPPWCVRAWAHSVRPSRTSIPNVLVFSYIHHQGSHDRGSYHLTLFLSRHLGHARTHAWAHTHSLYLSLEHNVVPIANRGCLASPFGGLKEKENFFPGDIKLLFWLFRTFSIFPLTAFFPIPKNWSVGLTWQTRWWHL